ncbi:putative ankyrin repeat domain protein [Aspergillus nomiae NRRL 13137]|uniref:Putative ankyrin repeat domain protein n=1 Tax=Aspergillus nomiae NRRL (strain ATCC 15546 / NRRL 13137 / CBS 260.88 / M93) TaxID=1509407 RepID=A0A0L1J300_ASPN3|nr:putative ankyrin repeat domain protein [Aspergillus nomiae NRRL 13137]KNG86035.1 putative ankyrin repeat domain protein [Aspergillus nomiae NRRL 13137]
MGHSLPQLDNSEYAVGWIAALPHERAAAKAMLDTVHAPPRYKHAKDHNSYTLGSINGPNGEHNVVIASLPSGRYGTVTAATSATQMLSSFPSIKFGLMVGIGGGIPSEDHDIRLGDVVVSQPTGAFGGVRQYDCGKVTAHGFEECGALNCPPEALLNAMGELQSNHEMMGGTSIPDILESMYTDYPAMAESRRGPGYIYQGANYDRLFSSDCIHENGAKDCGACDPEKEIKRPERLDQEPCIHYGTIASGNKVIKDAKVRDLLAKNCLCFEMEAAGLMNQFPCLIIRGICDYCDTHKNDRWQKYAAATAAAYAKELLQVTDASDIQNTPEARSIVMDNLSEIKTIVKSLAQNQEQKDLFRWLSPLSPSARHLENQKRRAEDTGRWIFEDPNFLNWSSERPGFRTLCCYGDPGAGKTIVSSIVIDRLRELMPLGSIGLAYLYGDYRDQRAQSVENILGAIVKQLLAHLSETPQGILEIYETRVKQENPLSLPDAERFLDIACEQFSRVYICLDALDELRDQRSLLISLQARSSSVQLYITGRPHVQVQVERHLKEKREILIEAHDDDIRRFIDLEIGGPNDIEPDAMDEKLRMDIQNKVIESAKGLFLLPVLQVHAILQATTIRRREEALKTLPSDLGDAFAGTMMRIEEQPCAQSEQARKILAWVYLAERPVAIDELLCSLAIEDNDTAFNLRGIPVRSTLINCCHGLVLIDQETSTVRLVHYSFQEYLCQQNQLFGVSKVQWHNQIARTCLTFLSFPSMSSEDNSMTTALMPYAATKWGHHLRKSEHLQDAPLELAREYLRTVSTHNRAGLHLLYREMYEAKYNDNELCLVASPAHIAAFFGVYALVLHLCLTENEVDLRDIKGQTPLSWAARRGHKVVAKLLIENGAALDSQDDAGRTPLLLALDSRHEAVALLLIENGAAVDAADKFNNGALSMAAQSRCEAVVKLLIEKGASMNTKNQSGRTPLSLAVLGGFKEIVKLLLDNGAAVEATDRYGRTPLLFAVSSGLEEIVKLLLDKEVNVEAFDYKYGRTPLIWAAAEGYETIARLLIEKGAEVNSVDSGFSWTPLAWAAVNGFEGISRLLLENGAEMESVEVNGYGRTPLLLALEARNEPIVKLLVGKLAEVESNTLRRTELVLCVEEKGLDALMDLLGFTTDHRGHRSKRKPNANDPIHLYFD